MLTYPDLDPVALSVGPLRVHWYGLMYLVGFAAGWGLGRFRARQPGSGWREAEIDDLVFYVALGAIIGGRLGYTFFYNAPVFWENPLTLFKIWQGGMSFHGGLVGVLVAMAIYAHRTGRFFFQVTDFIAPLVPPGLFAGRVGNFINGELWGGPTQMPWGFWVPAHQQVLHPSQLYEAALEGLALFLILWFYSRRPRPLMAVSAQFLLWYGFFRFAVELIRVPDAHIGYLAWGWLTMGQLLSLPMLLAGLALWFLAQRQVHARLS